MVRFGRVLRHAGGDLADGELGTVARKHGTPRRILRLDLRGYRVARDRTDQGELGSVFFDARQDRGKPRAARPAQLLQQGLVQRPKHRLRLGGGRHHQGIDLHFGHRTDVGQIATELAAAFVDQDQCVDQALRRIDGAKHLVAVREVLLALQDQKARQRPVGHVGRLQGLPEVQRRRGAVDAGAGLVDRAVRIVVLGAGVLDTEVRRARSGVELGHQIENLGHVAGRTLSVGRSGQEHPELVQLEQDCGLAHQRGQEARARGDLVAAQVLQ